MFRALAISLLGAITLAFSMLVVSVCQTPNPDARSSSLILTTASMVFQNHAPDAQRSGEIVLSQGVASSTFTYQGVLNSMNGSPATGPLALRFVFKASTFSAMGEETEVNLSDTIISSIFPDDDGRFQVQVPMPAASVVIASQNHRLQIFDVSTGTQIGSDIPVTPAPLAWIAEYARSSQYAEQATSAAYATDADNADTANYAENANFAETSEDSHFADFASQAGSAGSANVANSLSNDQTYTMVLNAGFAPYGNGYAAPTATRVGNVVYLSGLVNTVNNGSVIIATLPVGMRPAGREIGMSYSSQYISGGQLVRLDILTDGRIQHVSPSISSGNWFSLAGISFRVAD